MSEVSLQKVSLNPEEIKDLSDFAASIWREYWTDVLPNGQAEYMIKKFQSAEAMKEQMEHDNYSYFYIMSDGKRAGYTGLSLRDGELFLSKLYVLKEFRHRKIATRVFPLIVDFAVRNGRKRIVLTVNKGNINAINAYKKLNFREIDAVVTDIGNGYVMDDYIMEYTVTA